MKLRNLLSRSLAALWLLPLAVVLSLWVRSHCRLDEVSRVDRARQTQAMVSFNGAVHLVRSGNTASPRPMAWGTYVLKEPATREQLYTTGNLRWERLGFARIDSMAAPAAPPAPAAAAVQRTGGFSLLPWLMLRPLEAWIIPYWSLALLASMPELWRATRFAGNVIRRRQGRCVACGYDLRASPDQCPECGRERPPTGVSPSRPPPPRPP